MAEVGNWKGGLTEHGAGRVHADKHTGTNESGSPLKIPTPRLNVQRPRAVTAPDVNPSEEVPVVENTNSVQRSHAMANADTERDTKRLELANSVSGTSNAGMHGANSQSRGGVGGEHEPQLSGSSDDEELAQGSNEEESEERAADRQREDLANISRGCAVHDAETVHGRDTGHEDTSDTSSTGSGCLDDAVLLRTERASENGQVGLGDHLDDSVTEDGAEH